MLVDLWVARDGFLMTKRLRYIVKYAIRTSQTICQDYYYSTVKDLVVGEYEYFIPKAVEFC